MAAGDIYLGIVGGTPRLLTPYGRKYSEADIELHREDRTSQGTLVRDVIAVKKRFTISYSSITSRNLRPIEDLYNADAELELTVWYEGSTTTTSEYDSWDGVERYTVLMQPVEKTRMLLSDGGMWENVSITLDEV